MDSKSSGWGGKRPNSGRFTRNINLSPEAARELALLVKHRNNPTTGKQIIEEMIHVAWSELDQGYSDVAETASS